MTMLAQPVYDTPATTSSTASTAKVAISDGNDEEQDVDNIFSNTNNDNIHHASTTDDHNHNLVAILNSFIPWHKFFENAVRDSTPDGLILILRNNCGAVKEIMYRVDGSNVEFINTTSNEEEGNNGNTPLLQYEHTLSFENDNDEHNLQQILFPTRSGCTITVHVYPTREFQLSFEDNTPITYFFVIVSIFIIAIIVFLIYDHAVELRQRRVMSKVARSNAIVNSFFPTQVRDRLIGGNVNHHDDDKHHHHHDGIHRNDDDTFINSNVINADHLNIYPPSGDGGGILTTQQRRGDYNTGNNVINNPINDTTIQLARKTVAVLRNGLQQTPIMKSSLHLGTSKPIADLYPHATIMFADIANL